VTRTRRRRTLAAAPADVWAVVGDPYNLRRWWPRVERVEQVTAGEFTEVLRSDRGRTIRADNRLTELAEPSVITWEQEIEGTPFARVMSYSATAVRLKPAADGGTTVELERRQQMRGMSRFGGFMIRRATGRVLDGALDALAEQLQAPAPAP
jgi:uncharacterized protein YndB with AHSA1/START domain